MSTLHSHPHLHRMSNHFEFSIAIPYGRCGSGDSVDHSDTSICHGQRWNDYRGDQYKQVCKTIRKICNLKFAFDEILIFFLIFLNGLSSVVFAANSSQVFSKTATFSLLYFPASLTSDAGVPYASSLMRIVWSETRFFTHVFLIPYN